MAQGTGSPPCDNAAEAERSARRPVLIAWMCKRCCYVFSKHNACPRCGYPYSEFIDYAEPEEVDDEHLEATNG